MPGRLAADTVTVRGEQAIDRGVDLRTFALHRRQVQRADVVQVDIHRESVEIEVEDIERRSALQRETLRKHRVLRDLVQQLQEPQHLLQRIQSVSRLRGEPLRCLDGGRRHSKPLEAAFGNVDRNDDVPASRRPCRPGICAQRIARPGGARAPGDPRVLRAARQAAPSRVPARNPSRRRLRRCHARERAGPARPRRHAPPDRAS